VKICVIGTGYVGLVTGACLANLGHEVICVDKDKSRVASLKKKVIPFYEPGLKEIVSKNYESGRLSFTELLANAVKSSEVVFIAVGTPSKKNGEADISAVVEVAKSIAKSIKKIKKKGYKIIVNKSTVPVGMGDIVTKLLLEAGVPEKNFAVVSNPEFLREGSAVSDFMAPDRIVVGSSSNKAFNVITELYRPLNAHIIFTSVKSAELIKYASNSFLATKISFINEIANICERVGSDITEVADGMGMDTRIGSAFLNAGVGYGGSCFPKDVSALSHLARSNGYDPMILTSVAEVNQFQREAFVAKIEKELKKVKGKTIAVLGFSFKPETDDLRGAPSIDIIRDLLEKGAFVKAYDPVVKSVQVPGFGIMKSSKDVLSAVAKADALAVVTEWGEFVELDMGKVKKLMKKPVIFDGRNIYNPKRIRELGFQYFGVGR
jgi:UDPglucose 6-dehydrogenase